MNLVRDAQSQARTAHSARAAHLAQVLAQAPRQHSTEHGRPAGLTFEPAEPPPFFLPMLKLNPLFAMGGALSALPGCVDAAAAETSALRLAPTAAALS